MQLKAFAEKKGLRFVKQLNLEVLRDFREEWKDGPLSRRKKLERLRAWLTFCVESKWTEENHARKLHAPNIVDRPTLPFAREEMLRILTTFKTYGKSAGLANAQRLRAFVLLLRYSGMRIGDCVKVSTDQLSGNRLFLYTQKNRRSGPMCPARFRCARTGYGTEVERTLFLLAQRDWKMAAATQKTV